MPCLSAVWIYPEVIYFFVQVRNRVRYAAAELIGDEWKVHFV